MPCKTCTHYERYKYIDSYLTAKLFQYLRYKGVSETFIHEVPLEFETLLSDQTKAICQITNAWEDFNAEAFETSIEVQEIVTTTFRYIDEKENPDLEDNIEFCRRQY